MWKTQQDHRGLLSETAMKKIPADAEKYKIKTVIFSGGGDPLLNKHTIPTALKLKELKIRVGINNQGYLLENPDAFDFVRYSIDAANRDTYKKVHGVDGWERINKNIAHHKKLRDEGLVSEMGIAFLITPDNWQETYDFCVWANRFEPDFIHIRPAFLDFDFLNLRFPGGGLLMKEKIVPILQGFADKIEKEFKNVFFKVSAFEGYWTKKLYSKCRANTLIAVTSGDGAFLVCQDRGISASENYLRWGDYNKQSFENIWWSDEHIKVMNNIDLANCPRCVENSYNEIIEHCFLDDSLKMDLL